MTSALADLRRTAARPALSPLERWRIGAPFSRVPVYAWLAVLVAAPNAILFLTSLMKSSDGAVIYQPGLSNYIAVLSSVTVQKLAVRTLEMSLAAVLLATAIAYPVAYYISRHLRSGKTAAAMMIVVPLWVSLLMRDFAWRIILGEKGLLNTLLVHWGVISKPSPLLLYTSFTVILTWITVAMPYVFVAAYAAIERVPFSLLEAARDNGASPLRAFTTVVWPLTRQGTAIGVALAFLGVVGDYVTPSMLGGLDGTTLGMVVSSQFGLAGNWPLGAAMAIYLLILVVAVLAILFLLARSRGVLTEVDVGASPHVAAWSSLSGAAKLARIACLAALTLPYVLLYAPLAVMCLFSFNNAATQSLPLAGFTLRWYIGLASDSGLLDALWRSIELAFISVTLGILIGTAFAFVFSTWRGRLAGLMESLVALPVAVPGVVLGISMVMAASAVGVRPGMSRMVLGHVVFVMPVIMLLVSARLRRVDPSFALASRDLGAGFWSTFWNIQLPMVRGAVIAGGLLGFTMSVDEVIVTLFLSGTEPTLPVFVWNQTRFGFTPSVNAIFTCIVVVSFLSVVSAQFLIKSSARATQT